MCVYDCLYGCVFVFVCEKGLIETLLSMNVN